MKNKNRRTEKHGECLEISSHLRQMGEQFNGAMKGVKRGALDVGRMQAISTRLGSFQTRKFSTYNTFAPIYVKALKVLHLGAN
jgi:hypothetical protein